MTIPTTIPTGGHPADREFTEMQKAVLALLGGFSSDILNVANGGTGLASYTAGDLLKATGATTLAKLAIGASDTFLRSDGSAPAWFANPMASATSVAGQTITANSFQIVVYGTELRDTDSAYDPSTGRFTVPTAKGGDYFVTGGVGWNTGLTGEAVLGIFKNASEQMRAEVINPAASASVTISGIVNCAAGDILDIRVFQNSAGSVALRSAVAQQVFITIKRLG
jgi:hypothetical protein